MGAPPRGIGEGAWKDRLDADGPSMRAVKGNLDPPLGEVDGIDKASWKSPLLVQRAVSEDPHWTRAVGAHLARPLYSTQTRQ